jgi:hypothetical protein
VDGNDISQVIDNAYGITRPKPSPRLHRDLRNTAAAPRLGACHLLPCVPGRAADVIDGSALCGRLGGDGLSDARLLPLAVASDLAVLSFGKCVSESSGVKILAVGRRSRLLPP